MQKAPVRNGIGAENNLASLRHAVEDWPVRVGGVCLLVKEPSLELFAGDGQGPEAVLHDMLGHGVDVGLQGDGACHALHGPFLVASPSLGSLGVNPTSPQHVVEVGFVVSGVAESFAMFTCHLRTANKIKSDLRKKDTPKVK